MTGDDDFSSGTGSTSGHMSAGSGTPLRRWGGRVDALAGAGRVLEAAFGGFVESVEGGFDARVQALDDLGAAGF
ncbi:hypothetical protein [Streptomyces viridosporus]|uniref:hypothetical protein n=1 Tax=Streptomyces viridosporus TaxID=67581 RepID=UPI003330367E